MAAIGVILRFLALLVMYKISNPKIVDLMPPLENGPVDHPPQSHLIEVKKHKMVDESAANTRELEA